MLGRSKRDRREKIAIALKQREKLPSRCKENKTVAVSTSVYSEFEDEPSFKEYEICIGCGKDKANIKTDWIEMQFL